MLEAAIAGAASGLFVSALVHTVSYWSLRARVGGLELELAQFTGAFVREQKRRAAASSNAVKSQTFNAVDIAAAAKAGVTLPQDDEPSMFAFAKNLRGKNDG